jgi:hypothetical protein
MEILKRDNYKGLSEKCISELAVIFQKKMAAYLKLKKRLG